MSSALVWLAILYALSTEDTNDSFEDISYAVENLKDLKKLCTMTKKSIKERT